MCVEFHKNIDSSNIRLCGDISFFGCLMMADSCYNDCKTAAGRAILYIAWKTAAGHTMYFTWPGKLATRAAPKAS
jgi:hypothetical protein